MVGIGYYFKLTTMELTAAGVSHVFFLRCYVRGAQYCELIEVIIIHKNLNQCDIAN